MKAATSAHSTRPPLSESSQRKSKCRSLSPLYETNLLAGRLFWDFPYWNAVLRVQLRNLHVLMFMSEPGNPAELCHHFLTSLCRTQTHKHAQRRRANKHTCWEGQKWRQCTTVQVTSTCKCLHVFLLKQHFHKHEKKKCFLFPLQPFFLSNKNCIEIKMEFIHLCLRGSY